MRILRSSPAQELSGHGAGVYMYKCTFKACLRAPSSLSFTICSRQPSRYLKSPASWFLSALANFVPCIPRTFQWTD